MAHALPAGIPELEDTRHSRESIVHALRTSAENPSVEVAFGTLYADAIEPDVLAVLDRALKEDLDTPDQRLLFRGIHILGGRQLTSAFRPFIAFLRGPAERVEILGDAITETLPKILAGLFDGDDQPLQALITDTNVDSFVRAAALRAMGTLCFDGRIGPETLAAYLQRLDDERLLDDEFLWDAWMATIGVLGMADLAPRVRAAFADERIPPDLSSEKDFDQMLDAALARPDDRERLADEGMGTIEDVLAELERWSAWDDRDTARMVSDNFLDWVTEYSALHPAHNPFRDVGRNDPCPCGSGKKFKKCCLPTT